MATGFGRGLYCLDELQPGRNATGATLLKQSLYHRFTTPRGTLQGGDVESAYGLDLAGWVGSVGDATAAAALPSVIEAEASKDPRVAAVEATVTAASGGASGVATFTVRIDVTPADDGESFALTLAVSSVTVDILGSVS